MLDIRGDVILPSDKSPTKAFWLSFGLFAGVGQLYVGQPAKAALWMAAAVLAGLPTFGLGTLVANVASGVDAYQVACKLSHGLPAGTWDWFPKSR